MNPNDYDVDSKKIGDKLYIYDPNTEVILRFTKIAEDTWKPNALDEHGNVYPSDDDELDDELIQDWVGNAKDGIVYILNTPSINEAF